MKKKLVFISNMAAPYQVKFCYALQEYFDAEFWFYEYIDKTRPEWWKIPLGDKCKILKRSAYVPKYGYVSLSVFDELERFKPDIVLLGGFQRWHERVLKAAKRLGAKVAVMSEPLRNVRHDDQASAELFTKENSARQIKKLRKQFSEADLYIGMEDLAKNQLINEFDFPPEKVVSLSYPQDLDANFEHPLRDKEFGEPLTLLFANRLVERYQPLMALEVFRRLSAKYPHLSMRMNADGSQKDECVAFIKQHDLTKVSFLDQIDSWNNMHLIYQQSDILILPCVYSNGNGTVAEASASGMGVVMSDGIHNMERETRNKASCFICPLNTDDFEAAVEKYISQPELILQHGRGGRSLVRHHRNDYTAKTYYETFKKHGFLN